MTLDIATLCIEWHYAERHYAECRISFNVMLNVIILSVIMLSVVLLDVLAPSSLSVQIVSHKERQLMILHLWSSIADLFWTFL